MNTKSWVCALLICTAVAFSARPAHSAACEPAGGAELICGLTAPEDIVRVPDTNWILVSSIKPATYYPSSTI